MSRVDSINRRNSDHTVLLKWLRAKTAKEPEFWLPNMHYITRELILAAAALTRIYDRGVVSCAEIVLRLRYLPPFYNLLDMTSLFSCAETGRDVINPRVLGYVKETTEILQRFPSYNFNKHNPRQQKLEQHKFSEHSLARIKDVQADPRDSANPGRRFLCEPFYANG